jgi:hypothetical protein
LENIEFVLTKCIEEIKSGRSSLTDCLDRYQSKRLELEPLLKMALNIQAPPALKLDDSFKRSAKLRLLERIQPAKQKGSRSFSGLFSFGIPRQMVWARITLALIISVVVISMLAGGTAYASQNSLPGDILYPVKIETEDARIWLASSNSAKIELNLQFAQTRVEEMKRLAPGDEEKVRIALNGYRNNLNGAEKEVLQLADASSTANALEQFSAALQNHLTFCDNLVDSHPFSEQVLEEANSLVIKQQIDLLKVWAEQNTLRATQVNLGLMGNRLQRAQAKVNDSQYQAMQSAMLQYQQFNQLGEQILVWASNSQIEGIDNLSSQALSGYIEALDTLSQQVPQAYQNILEISKEQTLQYEAQAHYRYQNRGDPDQKPGALPSEDGAGNAIDQANQPLPENQEGPRISENGNPGPGATASPDGGGYSGNDSGTSGISVPPSQGSGVTGDGNGAGFDGGANSGGGPTSSPAGQVNQVGGSKP